MKTIKYFCALFLFGTILFSSCMNDEPDFGQKDDENGIVEGQGQVSLAAIKVEVNLAVTTKGALINTDNYIVRFYSTKNNLLVKEYAKLAEMPEIVTLDVGQYRVEVMSHKLESADWEKPFYKGSQLFEIKKDVITSISTVECTFQSIKVTVGYSDKLKKLLTGNQTVTVSIGDGNLVFNGYEQKGGYFAAVATTNVLIAKFQGTVDGEPVTMSKSFSTVKAGEYYHVVFDVEVPSIGDVALNFKLNAFCENVKIPILVSPGDESILPEDPTDNPGQGKIPTITGQGFNIADGVDLVNGEKKTVIVDIKAEEGIQNLKVVIDSDKLTDDVLQVAGVTRSFDLCYPGTIESGLKNLGFSTGVDVIGKQALVFDLTQFTELLGILGSGTHNFNITVVDAKGNLKAATLTMITIVNN